MVGSVVRFGGTGGPVQGKRISTDSPKVSVSRVKNGKVRSFSIRNENFEMMLVCRWFMYEME